MDEYGYRLRDRPQKPIETAMFWVEYVIRHHGALHMISPLVNQTFFVSNGFDVYLLVIAMSIFFYKLAKSFLSIVCKNMKDKYGNQEEEAKKKKKWIVMFEKIKNRVADCVLNQVDFVRLFCL